MSEKKKSVNRPGEAMPMHVNVNALPRLGDKMTVYVFTDPLCSDCWGGDPVLRHLELEYGDVFDTSYHLTGLWPEGFNPPSGIDAVWDRQARVYGMPMSGEMWRSNPPFSSHPACMAVKAAFLQGFVNGERYLRLLREFAVLDGRNIAERPVLDEAAAIAGLDPAKFKDDYDGKGRELLDADMKLAAEVGIRCIPTVIFKNDGKVSVVSDVKDYAVYETALKRVAPDAVKRNLPEKVEDLFERYTSMTVREMDELTCNMSTLGISSEANNLVNKKKLVKLTYPGGFLWRKLQVK